MENKRSKTAVVVMAIFFLAFVISTSISGAQAAAEQYLAKLPSGKEVSMTAEQLEKMKAHPGITFYKELPEELPEDYFGMGIPPELGGGYLVGTAESLASALNAAGVTVGADPRFVKGGLAAWIPIAAGLGAAAAAGGIAAGVTGGAGAAPTAPTHPTARTH